MVRMLDAGLRNYARVIERATGTRVDELPGAGAAGGLGAGLVAFLGAELKPGIQMVLEATRFDERIQGADLIITGEGKLDRHAFVRISHSEIVNLGKVTALDLSLTGTIRMTLAGDTVCYVSRRYVKKIKEALGL